LAADPLVPIPALIRVGLAAGWGAESGADPELGGVGLQHRWGRAGGFRVSCLPRCCAGGKGQKRAAFGIGFAMTRDQSKMLRANKPPHKICSQVDE